MVNWQKLIETCGDRELAEGLVNSFIEDAKSCIDAIETAFDEANTAGIKSCVHRIKGGAAAVTAQEMFEISLKLEKEAEKGDLESALDYFEKLKNEFGKFISIQAKA
jgi:HPt (histidine-containing phosphotransfer) domain-containing protein